MVVKEGQYRLGVVEKERKLMVVVEESERKEVIIRVKKLYY